MTEVQQYAHPVLATDFPHRTDDGGEPQLASRTVRHMFEFDNGVRVSAVHSYPAPELGWSGSFSVGELKWEVAVADRTYLAMLFGLSSLPSYRLRRLTPVIRDGLDWLPLACVDNAGLNNLLAEASVAPMATADEIAAAVMTFTEGIEAERENK